MILGSTGGRPNQASETEPGSGRRFGFYQEAQRHNGMLSPAVPKYQKLRTMLRGHFTGLVLPWESLPSLEFLLSNRIELLGGFTIRAL